jgi:hypothetical protein
MKHQVLTLAEFVRKDVQRDAVSLILTLVSIVAALATFGR